MQSKAHDAADEQYVVAAMGAQDALSNAGAQASNDLVAAQTQAFATYVSVPQGRFRSLTPRCSH